jgi:hypothetical protein
MRGAYARADDPSTGVAGGDAGSGTFDLSTPSVARRGNAVACSRPMPWGATHRGRVAVAIVATAVLCVASAMRTDPPLGAHTAHADVRPNIVLIMTDDMR